jgi:hypothetical protein
VRGGGEAREAAGASRGGGVFPITKERCCHRRGLRALRGGRPTMRVPRAQQLCAQPSAAMRSASGSDAQ